MSAEASVKSASQSVCAAPVGPAPDVQTLNAHDVLRASDQAGYRWDVGAGTLAWSEAAAALLGLGADDLATVRAFARVLDPGTVATREDAVLSSEAKDAGDGVGYMLTYTLAARADHPALTLEDRGRWYAGTDGRPAVAVGTVRRIDPSERAPADTLTGSVDRAQLDAVLEDVLEAERAGAGRAAARPGTAMVLVSLARLDHVNAIYGYHVGDELIREAARRLRLVMRGDDVIGRFSGAKFALVLRECSGADLATAATRFAEKLSNEILRTDRGPVSVAATIACVPLSPTFKDVRSIHDAATRTLAETRRDVGSRVGFYAADPVTEQANRRTTAVAEEVMEALDGDRMSLAWQPVVDATTHEVEFHEALVRLAAADGSVWPAEDFISTVTELDLVRPVDHRALDLALDVARECPDARFSLNVSNDTALDARWLTKFVDGVSRLPQGAGGIIVELTESHAARSLREARDFIETVQACGAKVALDDFGAGFTAFRQLHELPFDLIKIDGTFARDLAGSRHNREFIRSLVHLARLFQAKTVVEWVEDVESADMLRDWGVDYLQGYVFGRAGAEVPFALRS